MLFRLWLFFAIFFHVNKDSSLHFFVFCNRTNVTVFGIVRFFKSNNFCLKLGFLRPSTGPGFSQAQQLLLETKCFASIKHCSRFSVLCDLPETFIKKIFEKFWNFFPPFSVFFLRFTVEKGFSVVSSCRRIVFEIYGYPFGIFRRCKIDEILTIMSFYPWLSVWYCLFGFLQKFATFFASVCEARLRLCVYFCCFQKNIVSPKTF